MNGPANSTIVGPLLDQVLGGFAADPAWRAAALLAATVAAALAVNALVSATIRLAARRTETDLDDRLLKIVHRPVFVAILLAGVWLTLTEIGVDLEGRTFLPGLLQTLAVVVFLVAALRISSLVLDGLSRIEDRFPLVTTRTLPLFDNLGKGLILGGAIYFLCLAWGIDVGAWMVSAGVVGIAVGFAAKDTLANLFSGIFILADAPYKTGDFIVLESGERGAVTHIGLRSTRILTRDDIEITVPNAVIANAKIINETGGPWEKERVRVRVGVAYGSDVDRVRELLQRVAEDNPMVTDDPAPRVRLRGLGASSLDFELLAWIDEPVLRGRALDRLYTDVYKTLQRESIQIPFPQTDVWVRSLPPGGSHGES